MKLHMEKSQMVYTFFTIVIIEDALIQNIYSWVQMRIMSEIWLVKVDRLEVKELEVQNRVAVEQFPK